MASTLDRLTEHFDVLKAADWVDISINVRGFTLCRLYNHMTKIIISTISRVSYKIVMKTVSYFYLHF